MQDCTKLCKGCKVSLPLSYFNRHSATKDGWRSKCKECRRLEHISYRESNKDKIRIIQKICDNRKKTNKDYILTKRSKDSRRRAQKVGATPEWLTDEHMSQIKEFFEICKLFEIYTGQKYHVDHIVPLKSDTVCGLHVPWNLAVLSEKDNIKKSNIFYEHLAIDYSASAYNKDPAT